MLKFIKLIQFDKKCDKLLKYATYFLMAFGFLMIVSTTMGKDADSINNLLFAIFKQLVFTIFGYILMVLFQKYYKFIIPELTSKYLMLFTLGSLIIPRFFNDINGAYAWIPLPFGFTLQPAEFAKIMIIIIMSNYFSVLGDNKVKNTYISQLYLIFVSSCILIVVFIQNDFGSAFVMTLIALMCFLTGSHKFTNKYQRILLRVICAGVIIIIILLSPLGISLFEGLAETNYRFRRLLVSMNPFKYQYDWGYQIVQGLTAIATGGMFGVGFGGSLLKYGNFPETNTDFILAIIMEELGFVFGFLPIFIAYMFIYYRLIKYVLIINDKRSKIILMGVLTYFLSHFILNIGGVTSLIPLTGVPLLLISSGGSSAMSCLIAIGLAQSMIIKYKKGIIK